MLFPAVHTRSILFGFVLALAVAAALVAAPAAKGKETTLVAQAGERTGPVRHGAPPQRFHPKARRQIAVDQLVANGQPGLKDDAAGRDLTCNLTLTVGDLGSILLERKLPPK